MKEDKKMIDLFAVWRKNNKIPPYVSLADADNKLLLNLDNLLCIKTLFSVIKNRSVFQLEEFVYNPEDNLISSKEGFYNNQFIVSFYKKKVE